MMQRTGADTEDWWLQGDAVGAQGPGEEGGITWRGQWSCHGPPEPGQGSRDPAWRTWRPLGGAESTAGLRGVGNVLVKIPESCLKLQFHHCIMEGNSREIMGPFPSGIWLIGFV